VSCPDKQGLAIEGAFSDWHFFIPTMKIVVLLWEAIIINGRMKGLVHEVLPENTNYFHHQRENYYHFSVMRFP
jgi:hypothetical protein